MINNNKQRFFILCGLFSLKKFVVLTIESIFPETNYEQKLGMKNHERFILCKV